MLQKICLKQISLKSSPMLDCFIFVVILKGKFGQNVYPLINDSPLNLQNVIMIMDIFVTLIYRYNTLTPLTPISSFRAVLGLMENENKGVDLTIYSEHAFSERAAQVLNAGSVRCSRSFRFLWSYIHTLWAEYL